VTEGAPGSSRATSAGKRRFPFAELLGLTLETLGEGRAAASLDAGERHHNPNGVVHGGTVFALIDTAMGAATTSVVGPGERCASIEVHVRFLARVVDGPLRAEVEVVQRGSRVVQLGAEVRDGEGRLVATGSGSFAVF
jgi:acyl-CoA thioesterase